MTDRQHIYEGKAKTLFFHDDNTLIQYFKDDATAFNKKKHEIINSKGVLNNYISEFIFKYLEENGIKNHFIKRLNDREQLIKKVEIIISLIMKMLITIGLMDFSLGGVGSV